MRSTIFILTMLLFKSMASAEEVVRIEVGKNYEKYSDSDLRRRLWELERAVYQLQTRIFELESPKNRQGNDSWVCTISTIGNKFIGTGATKAVAIAKAMESCKDGNKGDGFFCRSPSCEQ